MIELSSSSLHLNFETYRKFNKDIKLFFKIQGKKEKKYLIFKRYLPGILLGSIILAVQFYYMLINPAFRIKMLFFVKEAEELKSLVKGMHQDIQDIIIVADKYFG